MSLPSTHGAAIPPRSAAQQVSRGAGLLVLAMVAIGHALALHRGTPDRYFPWPFLALTSAGVSCLLVGAGPRRRGPLALLVAASAFLAALLWFHAVVS